MVKEVIARLRKSGEIEPDDLVYLDEIADRWIRIAEGEPAEGAPLTTVVKRAGGFTPFAFAISDHDHVQQIRAFIGKRTGPLWPALVRCRPAFAPLRSRVRVIGRLIDFVGGEP